jgi:hypothetical protein
VFAVGQFERGKHVDGELFISSPHRTYKLKLENRGRSGVIDRPRYQIALELDEPLPTRGQATFAGGDRIDIEWHEGRVSKFLGGVTASRHRDVLPPHVVDDGFAAAILIADDLAWRAEVVAQPAQDVRVRRVGREPEVALITYRETHYLDRIGLAVHWSPSTTLRWCLLEARCEIAIEGPDGRGLAVVQNEHVVQRPAVVDRPLRAWKDIVPGRVTRMRGHLIDCERALAEATTALAKPSGDLVVVRDAASRSLANFREAVDALDDIIDALPIDRPSALRFETLRDEVRDQLAVLELVAAVVDSSGTDGNTWAELRRIAAFPDVATIRVELSKVSP